MTEYADSGAGNADFEVWANLFTRCRAFGHPSELHGGLCGRLAAGARLEQQQWLDVVCEHMGIAPEALAGDDDIPDELPDFMADAYRTTLEELRSSALEFQPLLPEDDYAFEQRLQALSAWVRGFLEGMAVAAGERLGEAPGEIRELIEDMVAISQVEEAADADEAAEVQLNDITEYVRLGVVSVFTEFNPPEKPSSSAGQTLH
ncbi:hypothetical protein SAMN05216203_1707 [Marinobacter daqiaonensis]|uniref:YecA family protein n=1 Tax=Marinobacter daqiaonensis TaxID=650891 RepID=A0A1I6I0T4_9GAMM|nr:UPF0149 family protein [Marinobacter daqiaonensis]SFR60274.1 hypothetical protein SAMN05216203_1707 [Marinobacter daqiaonensis]